MIHVCDAIMGSGKTSAAIQYMNEHKDEKFIFITPYLDEASRIKKGCPSLHFVEPSSKLKEYGFKKTAHTAALIKEGRNITTTHQAFKRYAKSVIEDIELQGYILIIDENVDVLENYEISSGDLKMAIEGGYIVEKNGEFCLSDRPYEGTILKELFSILQSRNLFRIGDDDNSAFYWMLPHDLITSFKEVFILTYLFEGQTLHHLLKIYNVEYDNIGINLTDDGVYRFCSRCKYIPNYVRNLKSMIHILDNRNLNDIGEEYYSMSINWFERCKNNIPQLKNNISNYFNNIHRDIPARKRLCGSYCEKFGKIKGKGYTKAFMAFNARATNAYRDRNCLAYIANVFMNVNEKNFYRSRGLEVDDDIYAISTMVQWIWRSAIRDGEEIYIYIPSKRMRTLLINWIEETSKGGESVND